MENAITREMITDLMRDRHEIPEKLNEFISPAKKIQPHKGVQLDGIHFTPDGCWSAITFPQWVKCSPSWTKTYRFVCDENGEFIEWVK